ncbi:MAG: hypothetical protein HYX88_04070 [Chloroflexi bacterium]|nr:hypothetical protein [Chloroflexota bacterium]
MVQKLNTLAKTDPDKRIGLILHPHVTVDQCIALLANHQVEIKRRFRLIPAVAIEAMPREALRLASEPWVKFLEEDRQVKAL